MLIALITVLSAAFAGLICYVSGAFSGLWWLLALPGCFVGLFVCLAGVAVLVLWLICRTVDLDVPQEEDSPLFRKLVKLYAPAILFVVQTTVHTSGLEMTPKEGRFLLVCNHLEDIDPVILMRYFCDGQLAFISKRENRDMFIVGKVMHRCLCQMINRENDREALKTILKCIDLIRQDKASVAVFPEGYTSLDGHLQPFRHGAFKIATKTKVPIVVCTLKNADMVFKNAKRLRHTDVDLHLLKVIQPEEYEGLTAVELGTRIHTMMAKDLGEYVEE